MRIYFFFISLLVFISICNNIIAEDNFQQIQRAIILNGDTIPHVTISEIFIFKSRRYSKKYSKLIHDIKKTLPLAKVVGTQLRLVDAELKRITDNRARKAFLKITEKNILDKYGSRVRKLSFSQGKILLKLIDRECNNTSYELIKAYRGGFSAFMWQTLARTLGSNLKTEYNEKNDQLFEETVCMIERGEI